MNVRLRQDPSGVWRVASAAYTPAGCIPLDPRGGATDIALDYFDAGFLPIPIDLDGTKSPYRWMYFNRGNDDWVTTEFRWGSWAKYRVSKDSEGEPITDAEGNVLFQPPERPKREHIEQWFDRPSGIGIACGVASGNLEVLDFDDPDLFEPWKHRLPASLISRLVVVETGSLGFHAYYRCAEVAGNKKLATWGPDREGKTRIETRGQDGYVIAPGSPLEVHTLGNPYVQTGGPVLVSGVMNVPTVTPAERDALWTAAAAFHYCDPYEERLEREAEKRLRAKRYRDLCSSGDLAPWDDFDHRGDWPEILEPKGWSQSRRDHWSRPGKRHGTSAVVGRNDDGLEILTVFSSNAGELAPTGAEGYASYGKFNAYRLLYHEGDSGKAASDLKRKGYGR